jgi:hypothetical protein
VSHFRTDFPSGERPVEMLYPGKSPWRVCLRLLGLALLTAVVAVAFAASEDFRTKLRVERTTAPWAAALAGGGATILFVCAAWMWHVRLRWVVVSPAGLRWKAGRRIRSRKWDQYVRIERGSIEMTVYGEELKTGRYADVLFKWGRPLRISTHNIEGYEDLIGSIQTSAASSVRLYVPGGSKSGFGDQQVTVAHGPLQFEPTGLAWGGNQYRWDEIDSYEVAAGMLRIQPTTGPEFLRRLCDLGEWKPAVARLDANIGSRRVGKGAAPQQAPTGS